ncbi:response regulator [Radicibacter daui]|uniref:response regulator n=1 Tax=Radicibacter daui TaxID=3064829 RepID=UPI004046FAC3
MTSSSDNQSIPAGRRSLLLVDDQPINLLVLHAILKDEYEIFIATSGEQALELCAARKPDLVLLDMMMPQMDGQEVCRRLKADPVTQGIAVLLVTAWQDEEAATAVRETGAAGFVPKPVDADLVRASVKALLAAA